MEWFTIPFVELHIERLVEGGKVNIMGLVNLLHKVLVRKALGNEYIII